MRPSEAIKPGAMLAYVGPHAAACEEDIPLLPGDVVEVVDVVPEDDSVVVLVLRGRKAGRTGVVHVDLQARSMRGWRRLTVSGSVERQRRSA